MTSTFHGIETSRRGLFSQQAAINTTGHNISNASTAGYSRQRVNLTAATSIEAYGMTHSTATGQLGTGVEVKSINRLRSAFLDQQFREQNAAKSTWTKQVDSLSMIEGIVNEPSETGLRTVLDNFYNAWSNLSKDPSSLTSRTLVAETATAMASTFNHISGQLTQYEQNLEEDIRTTAADVNSKLESIKSLNTQIRKLEAYGDDANDLRDQRDLLVDQLSGQMNITISESDTGYRITTGGTPLLDGDTITEVTAGSLKSAYDGKDLTSGELHGMMESRYQIVEGYLNKLNTLANTIANGNLTIDGLGTIKGVNALHKLGYTFEDPAQPGADFFTSTDNGTITAANFQFNPVLYSNPGLIATSMRLDGGTAVKGDNSLALYFAKLGDSMFSFDESSVGNGVIDSSITDYYSSIVGMLGVASQDAQRQLTNSTAQTEQVDSNRMAVSGVSLDEEMSNLIMYQQAYSASARVMTAIDEMLQKLINGTGRVGL